MWLTRSRQRRIAAVVVRNVVGLVALFLSCDNGLHQVISRFAADRDRLRLFGHSTPVAVGSLILSASIAGVFYVVRGVAISLYDRQVREFFGVDRDRLVKFVIPSYRCVGNEKGPIGSFGHDAFHDFGADMFYKCSADGTLVYKKAFQSPICSSVDVESYFFAVRMLGPAGLEFRFEIDEKFINPDRMMPRSGSQSECRTVICFGSGSSNYLGRYMETLPFFNHSEVYSYDSVDSLIKNEFKRKRIGKRNALARLRSDPATDYAIVARCTFDQRMYFLCAGIDQAGSIAATQILLDQWQALYAQTGDRDFFYVYKIDRKALRPEELYVERNTASPVYKFVGNRNAGAPDLLQPR